VLPNIEPNFGLEHYLTTIFETTEGYVYLATKDQETSAWDQSFFQWPEQRSLVEEFIVGKGQATNVYMAPALFSSPSSKKRFVKGSHVYWADFDGNIPSEQHLIDSGIPAPTLRVRSSTEDHEHWYWRSEEFNTSTKDIDGVNRSLAITLGADMSGWDADQVLRPPFTTNFKNSLRVDLIEVNNNSIPRQRFTQLDVSPETTFEEFDENSVEPLQYIVGRYNFTQYELDRMAPTPKGDKSDRIYEIAQFCAEKGMADKEIFSVVYWADKRVAKFSERTDKIHMYSVLVARARAKHPLKSTIIGFEFRTASEILNDPVEIEWQIEGLLQRSGIMLLAGSPGVGKSQISMRALMAMAMGQEKFLGLPLQEGCQPAIFFSLEMPTVELKILFQSMLKSMTQDERNTLDKYLLWHDAGLPINFRDPLVRQRVEKSIEENGIQTLAIDSLSKMGIRKMQDEEAIIEMMEWFDHVRFTYNTSIWVIHHNRKANSDRKADTLDDVYGSRFLTAGATSIVTMDRNGKKDLAKLRFEKIRTAPEKAPMTVRRQPHNLDFMVEGIQSMPDVVEAELDSQIDLDEEVSSEVDFNGDL